MYLVTLINGTTRTEIHNEHHKLFSGSVVKGINTIDSFSFSVLPDNPAFGALRDFTSLVTVYNTARQRYEFFGRVLYTSPQMSDKGLITQEAICESYLGFLCDSQQEYVAEQNWTVRGLLEHIINCHNSQLEDYKHFRLGRLEVTDPNDNVYTGIQRENTWETIKKKLIEVLGGEICFRESDGVLYLDYVEKLGETKSTEIALSKNMKSIIKEKNPSAFVTRLIPLGAKKSDNTEERYGIASVNDGKNYIDDPEAIAEYGLHVGYVEFDDVTEPSILLTKARKWLADNNKVSVKYSITALDLSLIGLDVDDFDVCNTYPLRNPLLGIDDLARINKKTIDVCDETKTSIEIGESFKTLSELQREQMVSVGKLNTDVADIIRNYATNQRLNSEINRTVSLIQQTEEDIVLAVSGEKVSASDYGTFEEAMTAALAVNKSSILLEVSGTYATQDYVDGKLALTIKTGSNGEKYSLLSSDVDRIVFNAGELEINTPHFSLLPSGELSITGGEIKIATSRGEEVSIDGGGLCATLSSTTGIYRKTELYSGGMFHTDSDTGGAFVFQCTTYDAGGGIPQMRGTLYHRWRIARGDGNISRVVTLQDLVDMGLITAATQAAREEKIYTA